MKSKHFARSGELRTLSIGKGDFFFSGAAAGLAPVDF
jgi:hypothetical protein